MFVPADWIPQSLVPEPMIATRTMLVGVRELVSQLPCETYLNTKHDERCKRCQALTLIDAVLS